MSDSFTDVARQFHKHELFGPKPTGESLEGIVSYWEYSCQYEADGGRCCAASPKPVIPSAAKLVLGGFRLVVHHCLAREGGELAGFGEDFAGLLGVAIFGPFEVETEQEPAGFDLPGRDDEFQRPGKRARWRPGAGEAVEQHRWRQVGDGDDGFFREAAHVGPVGGPDVDLVLRVARHRRAAAEPGTVEETQESRHPLRVVLQQGTIDAWFASAWAARAARRRLGRGIRWRRHIAVRRRGETMIHADRQAWPRLAPGRQRLQADFAVLGDLGAGLAGAAALAQNPGGHSRPAGPQRADKGNHQRAQRAVRRHLLAHRRNRERRCHASIHRPALGPVLRNIRAVDRTVAQA